MVNEQYLRSIFENKRVFVTGHTGFKGAWLIQILHWLGADVKGFSLAPEKTNDLYNQIDGDKLCYNSIIGDLRDLHLLQGELVRFEPDFVFHLAAQSLVRRSYDQPVDTFMVNTQGTVHVLEAIRSLAKPCVALMITTDKVYENPERGVAFKEDDKLGGYDPYSASKAAAEIVIDSYRRSFFHADTYNDHRKAVASVRAGNVIGGGDYSDDRIIPDIVRALDFDESVGVRNPNSIRPWQHVLEPLGAYLMLAARMSEQPVELSTAFNFGPNESDMLKVEELVKIFLTKFGKGTYKMSMDAKAPHEAKLLLLDSSKAHQLLNWQPKLDAKTAIEWTADWYANRDDDANTKCLQQIKQYFSEG
ncbi:MAG: CDP-glucose 4,6-dehydratase [Flavipsychrobacter sp.]|jgi:CDP-glucose 4,6-dehydratase|nr:CDP-glucose 4,6-dehydratase [Flavipsychrobacter sp.]